MSSFHFYHCISLRQLHALEQDLGLKNKHCIPLSKILHTLSRKGYLNTIIWEKGVVTKESEAEAKFYGYPDATVDRLHFFSATLDSIKDIKLNPGTYGGYCDLRRDSRSVLVARITQNAVVREKKETYAYLCCKMSHSVELAQHGSEVASPPVITFPCCEKDNRAVMCSQAALLALIEYWNYRSPGMFETTDAIEINRKAGVSDQEILSTTDGRGLNFVEIIDFFIEQNVHALPLVYKPESSNKPKDCCRQDIYGFIESGFPVMLCIKLKDDALHALLCVGHTYDRNSWMAMADIGYFQNPSSGGGKYHANTTWIRNFIVHDDNFGPFYFMPLDKIEECLIAGFVVLPTPSVNLRPTEAADAAYAILDTASVKREIQKALKSGNFAGNNLLWLSEFFKHLEVRCGDGLVLRPIVIPGKEVIKLNNSHEFEPALNSLVSEKEDEYYWYVELSWPDIYCHRQMCCGCVVIEASSCLPIFLHIPGMCVTWEEENVQSYIARNEDAPRPHFGEETLSTTPRPLKTHD